jgi:tetratricopeptide (TPR) repeat protein
VWGRQNTVTIQGGVIRGNAGHGVVIWGDNNKITISGGEMKDNGGHGVHVYGDNNFVSVSGCEISGNDMTGLYVEGDSNIVEISGGTILGKNGDDVWIVGKENTWTVAGGRFGDDGSSHRGERAKIGYREQRAFLRGLELRRKGRCDDSIKYLSDAIRLNPRFARAYNSRGNSYKMKSEYAKALADYGEAIRINPHLGRAYHNRGELFVRTKDFDRAILDHTQAIQLITRPAALRDIYLNRSRCFLKTGEKARAIDDYLQGTRLQLEVMPPYAWRGDFYDVYIKILTAMIDAGKSDSKTHHGRACFYFAKGMLEEAIEDWTRAIEIEPDHGPIYVYRARAHERRGDKEKADADYAMARELLEDGLERSEKEAID